MAAKYLEENGYQIVDQNVRTPYGEIDLVAKDGEELVFVEVKARRSRSFGWPEDAVTKKKQEHLKASALAFLQDRPELDVVWRFDVVAINAGPGYAEPEIVHFECAFD